MVLNELGARITKALAAVQNSDTIDEKVLEACLKEICTALLQADVNVKIVMGLREGVRKRVNNDKGAGHDKRKVVETAVIAELCSMLDSGVKDEKKQRELTRNKPNVVMFVGLQVHCMGCLVIRPHWPFQPPQSLDDAESSCRI